MTTTPDDAEFRTGLPDGSETLVLPKRYYDTVYARHAKQKEGTWRHWTKQPQKHLFYASMVLADPPILDIGCGAGHLAAMYCAFGRQAHYAGGIDYSKEAIALARMHAPWASFAVGDAAGHPDLLARSHYRTAVFLEVLEHVLDDRRLFTLVPPGRGVVFSVPSFETRGHCRWFANSEQVARRYWDLLDVEQIVVEEGLASNNLWFVVKGLRR